MLTPTLARVRRAVFEALHKHTVVTEAEFHPALGDRPLRKRVTRKQQAKMPEGRRREAVCLLPTAACCMPTANRHWLKEVIYE